MRTEGPKRKKKKRMSTVGVHHPAGERTLGDMNTWSEGKSLNRGGGTETIRDS